MAGLQNLLKMFGQMKVGKEMWVWDYANDKPVLKKEMTKEMMAVSEKAKYQNLKDELEKFKK